MDDEEDKNSDLFGDDSCEIGLGDVDIFEDDDDDNDNDDDGSGDLGNVFDDDNDDGSAQEQKKRSSTSVASAASKSSATYINDDLDADSMMSKRKLLESGDRSNMPPPTWHSDAADKPHRESMTREIALLLKARKKTAPTAEWLQQLPHKARVLEDRLYRNAASLEAYLSRATLKNRLKKLAVTITNQYKGASKSRSSSFGSRRLSGTSSSIMSAASSMNSVAMGGSSFLQRSISDSAAIRGGNNNLNNDINTGGFMPPEVALSELERQKLVNEQLQRQILENIRQQQQLVQSISQKSGSTNSTGSNGSNLHRNNQPQQQDRRDANQFSNLQRMGNLQQQQQQQQIAAMNANQFSGLHGMTGPSGSSSGRPDSSGMLGSPLNNNSGGTNDFALRQAALLRHQPMPMQNNTGSTANSNLLNSSMQGNMQMLRNSNNNSMLVNQAPGVASNQAAALQTHVAFMQQAGGQATNAAAQAEFALMRHAAGGQLNPQAMAALLRQGNSNSGGFSNAAGLMNQQSGGNTMMPGGMVDMSLPFASNPQVQPNAALLQQLSGGGGIAGLQPSGMSQMPNLTNNAGNASGGSGNFQSKNAAEDLSLTNSFEW